MSSLLFASCRVAFAALVHDLGKFAERAKLPISQDALDSHKTLYCPFNQEGNYRCNRQICLQPYLFSVYPGAECGHFDRTFHSPIYPNLWRTISNKHTPVATETFNDDTEPAIGMLIN